MHRIRESECGLLVSAKVADNATLQRLRSRIVSELVHREASLVDIEEIWGLLRDVAADISLPLASDAEQELALTRIMQCLSDERSTVVVGPEKNILGVLLAQRDLLDLALAKKETINVCMVAVPQTPLRREVLDLLLKSLISRGAPVYVGVSGADSQGLADALKENGFAQLQSEDKADIYKWEPPAPAAKAA
jgi:hypothetical protein